MVVFCYMKDSDKNFVPLAYSRKEASHIIGVSPVTLDRLTKRGLINPSRATRRPLYPKWEIERFLRETSEKIKI